MYILKQPLKVFFGREAKLFIVVLLVATLLPQISSVKPASADNGGYTWSDAAYVDANYDWGYSTCPISAPGCMGISQTVNGVKYGEEDLYTMQFRNCTSYAAWKINQYFSQSFSQWGNAASWPSHAPTGSVHSPSSYTPVVGDLAQWGTEVANGAGHVAFVYAVDPTTHIASLDEYNAAGTGNFTGLNTSPRTTASTSAGTPDNYIHIGTIKPTTTIGDYNNDGTTDISLFRPSDGSWHVRNITDFSYGQTGDIPVPGDYNGDGVIEGAVFRPSTGYWYDRGGSSIAYGQSGDIPVPADWNGDGTTDIAVYRPSDGSWHIRGIADFTYGQTGDIPVPGDYDGNSTIEAAVYRPSTGYWYIRGGASIPYGLSSDIPMPADYNADKTTDVAVFRPSDGSWHMRNIADFSYGQSGDIPLVGDFDGNGVNEAAVYRPSAGYWYIRGGTSIPYGYSTDIPVLATLNAALLKQVGLISGY